MRRKILKPKQRRDSTLIATPILESAHAHRLANSISAAVSGRWFSLEDFLGS
jgi:hypothetical protein